MASFAFINAFLSVNSVDLSDHVRSVTLNVEAEELDDTAMSDTFRSRLGGLKTWSLQVEWNQDFAAPEIDATIWPLLGTTTAVVMRPDAGVKSATNPEYTGNVLVASYPPLGNAVGELATVSTTWPGAGTLTRATS